VLIELFPLAITVEALWADIGRNFAVWKEVGQFERKFQEERGIPANEFWHQKTRVPGLSSGEKMRKISTGWVGCTNVTDRRQRNGRAIAYSERERKFTSAKNQETFCGRLLTANFKVTWHKKLGPKPKIWPR